MATPKNKRKSQKSVTLNDVAENAGVSYQTVSRVINNHPNVAESTRQRVMASIRALNYSPNQAARSLVTKRSDMIAIINFGPTYYGPSQMVSNIIREAKRTGYRVTLSTMDSFSGDDVRIALTDIRSQLIDGLIMIAPVFFDALEEIRVLIGDIPFVQIDMARQNDIASVVIEQAYGAQLATEHLIDLGHRQIAEISGPLNWYGAVMRHENWLSTMQTHELPEHMTVEGDWSAQSGYEAVNTLLDTGHDFTGIVAGNDQMAIGAIAALTDAGRSVPEDVSVVGFDNIPEAAYLRPALTTIYQDFAALGEQSVDYLVSLIKNPQTPVHQRVLYPELIIRNSTRDIS